MCKDNNTERRPGTVRMGHPEIRDISAQIFKVITADQFKIICQ